MDLQVSVEVLLLQALVVYVLRQGDVYIPNFRVFELFGNSGFEVCVSTLLMD